MPSYYASYGQWSDVVNRIPIDSAYPGGKSLGMPAANRYRDIPMSAVAAQPPVRRPTNWLPIAIVVAVIALVVWSFKNG